MMRTHVLLSTIAAAASLATFAPVAASAQSFGVYVGQGYSSYPAYDYPYRGYQPRYDDERREAWRAHERWEQRRAWEQRERWERQEDAQRRYWDHERTERREGWRDDD